MRRREGAPREPEFPNGWAVGAFLCALVAAPVMFADLLGAEVPTWAWALTATSLVVGISLATVGTYERAKSTGRPWFVVVGKTLWAPFRFILDHTF